MLVLVNAWLRVRKLTTLQLVLVLLAGLLVAAAVTIAVAAALGIPLTGIGTLVGAWLWGSRLR